MLTLEPGEYFGIVRQLPNSFDTGTYYVRAVVRNAGTDALIDTVDLTDRGSGRFSVRWQVYSGSIPMFISIVTSVYEDSGYTSKSQFYGDGENTYLIDTRMKHVGGPGGTLTPGRVGEAVSKEFRKLLPEILEAVRELKEAVDDGFTSTGEKMRGHSVAIRQAENAVDAVASAVKEAGSRPPTDLLPVIKKIGEAKEENARTIVDAANEAVLKVTAAVERTAKESGEAASAEMAKNLAAQLSKTAGELKEVLANTAAFIDAAEKIEAAEKAVKKVESFRTERGAKPEIGAPVPSPREIIRGLRRRT